MIGFKEGTCFNGLAGLCVRMHRFILPPLRIVQANAVYDPACKNAGALLDRYHTLTEWSVAVAAAGATVSVVQRFHTAGRVERDGVTYEFVADSQPPWLSTKGAPAAVHRARSRAQSPDVVHVNGLIFPQLVAGNRAAAVGTRVAIVAQHHGGEFPIRGSGLVGIWQRQRWRKRPRRRGRDLLHRARTGRAVARRRRARRSAHARDRRVEHDDAGGGHAIARAWRSARPGIR